MSKERRLGRGLEALLGRRPKEDDAAPGEAAIPKPTAAEPPAVPPPAAKEAPGAARLDMSRIDRNPAQPRKDFEEEAMESLSESLETHGLLQPIVVRKVDDRYELIAGERRLRAAQKAGWSDVPANIVEADDRASAELAIVENMQRKDLNPLEKAASFQRYLEQYGCTQEELAKRLKLDRSTVANLIRLLELPEPVQAAIREGAVTQGHARALLPLGDEREQVEFCQRIQREGLNVRQTETLVQEMIAAADQKPQFGVIGRDGKPAKSKRTRSRHITAMEQELRATLGSKVSITHNAKGKGKMVIHFGSHEEFERLRLYLLQQDRPEVKAG
jgi:ParB family chromosome partitioning protein